MAHLNRGAGCAIGDALTFAAFRNRNNMENEHRHAGRSTTRKFWVSSAACEMSQAAPLDPAAQRANLPFTKATLYLPRYTGLAIMS
jgi:hypothetical protein